MVMRQACLYIYIYVYIYIQDPCKMSCVDKLFSCDFAKSYFSGAACRLFLGQTERPWKRIPAHLCGSGLLLLALLPLAVTIGDKTTTLSFCFGEFFSVIATANFTANNS